MAPFITITLEVTPQEDPCLPSKTKLTMLSGVGPNNPSVDTSNFTQNEKILYEDLIEQNTLCSKLVAMGVLAEAADRIRRKQAQDTIDAERLIRDTLKG